MMNYTRQIIGGIAIPIILLLMSFITEGNNPIELRLNYTIGEKYEYIIKTKRVGNTFFPGFGYKNLTETKVQIFAQSIDEHKNVTLNCKQHYVKISDSAYNKKWATFDTRVKTSNRLSNLHSLQKDMNVPYSIELNDRGEVRKSWSLENGEEAGHSVLQMQSFQLVFPEKKVDLNEKWEYETQGVFAIHNKSKFTFWVKKYDKNEVHIGFESILETEDVNNGAKAYGEYILDAATNTLRYAKIEGGVDGNSDFLEIEKIE